MVGGHGFPRFEYPKGTLIGVSRTLTPSPNGYPLLVVVAEVADHQTNQTRIGGAGGNGGNGGNPGGKLSK